MGDFNGPLRGDAPRAAPRRAGGAAVTVCRACPCEPTQLGRVTAVDGAVAFTAAHGGARGAGAVLRVACTALWQGGDWQAGAGGRGGEPEGGKAAALQCLDTLSLEEFPALGLSRS